MDSSSDRWLEFRIYFHRSLWLGSTCCFRLRRGYFGVVLGCLGIRQCWLLFFWFRVLKIFWFVALWTVCSSRNFTLLGWMSLSLCSLWCCLCWERCLFRILQWFWFNLMKCGQLFGFFRFKLSSLCLIGWWCSSFTSSVALWQNRKLHWFFSFGLCTSAVFLWEFLNFTGWSTHSCS